MLDWIQVNETHYFILKCVISGWNGSLGKFLVSCSIAAAGAAILRKIFSGRKIRVESSMDAVLVTGASRGIGKSIAMHLAAKGILVFAGVRKIQDAKNLENEHSNIFPIFLDVESDESIENASIQVTKILKEKSGRLIGIVNNAGYAETNFVELFSRNQLAKQFDVNLFGPLMVTRYFLPLLRESHIKKRSSRVIFISSGLEDVSMVRYGAYSATKHAMIALTDALRLELGMWNIPVIRIIPGVTKTDMQDHANHAFLNNLDKMQNPICGDQVLSKYKSVPLLDHGSGVSPMLTSEKVVDALYDTHPLRIYAAGDHAWSSFWLSRIFPRSLVDSLFLGLK